MRFRREGERLFELSLDRVITTDLVQGGSVRSVEAELEIIAGTFTEAEVRQLLTLSEELQTDFYLAPSVLSKGAVTVEPCGSEGPGG